MIGLCADDYGLSPGVSRSIRELAAAGRITAASAMTVFPDWPEAAAGIRDLAGTVDLGLHLVLTDAPSLTRAEALAPGGRFPPLPRLLARAQAGRLPRAALAAEIARQLAAFEDALGFPPAFVDGHQHVHVLPGVREAVAALFGPRLDPAGTWLRVCTSRPAAIVRRRVAVPRALILDRLSRPLRAIARRRGLAANDDFRGVTAFPADRVADEFAAFLLGPGERPLVMCHPGHLDDLLTTRDPVHARRAVEHAFLSGSRWPETLSRAGRTLARPSALCGTG